MNVIVDKERERERERDTGRQAGRQADRQTDRQTKPNQTNKQTNKQTVWFGQCSLVSETYGVSLSLTRLVPGFILSSQRLFLRLQPFLFAPILSYEELVAIQLKYPATNSLTNNSTKRRLQVLPTACSDGTLFNCTGTPPLQHLRKVVLLVV